MPRTQKLRIFGLAPDCHVNGWRYQRVWRKHFYGGLEHSGAKVTLPRDLDYAWARPVADVWGSEGLSAKRTVVSEQLWSQIEAALGEGLDLVVSYCFSSDIDPELVTRVVQRGVPWVNFFCDSVYAFDYVRDIAARTSLNWYVETHATKHYRNLGVPAFYAPYALNPRDLPDASCQEVRYPVAFVGTANRKRVEMVTMLRVLGMDLHVRGWGWPEALGPQRSEGRLGALKGVARWGARRVLSDRVGGHMEDMVFEEELRRTQVVLGLNEGGLQPRRSRSYLKLRDVEFPGMGCCYLTQHNDDVEAAFEVGTEVLTFRSLLGARNQAARLAAHPRECLDMGQRARARVLAEHTWARRLEQIVERLR